MQTRDEERIETRAEAGTLRALALNHFVATFGFAMSYPFLSIYCHNVLGVSMADTGIAFGALGLVRAASQYISGELSDRFRPASLMMFSLLARAASFALISVAMYTNAGFAVIFGLTFAGTIAGSAHQIAAQTAVAVMIPDAHKLRAYAVTRAAANVGFAAGPALGGFLISTSFVLPFAITSLLLLLSVAAVFKLPQTAVARPGIAGVSGGLVPGFRLYLFGLFLLSCVMAQIITPLSLFVVSISHVSEAGLGGLYTLNGIMVVGLQVAVTRMLSAYRHQTVLVFGSLVYFLSYSLLGFGSEYLWFLFVTMGVTMGEIIAAPPSLAHAERVAPPGKAGRYLGLAGVAMSLGWFAGPLYGASTLENLTPAWAWVVNASPALAAALIFGSLAYRERILSRVSAPTVS